VKFFKLT